MNDFDTSLKFETKNNQANKLYGIKKYFADMYAKLQEQTNSKERGQTNNFKIVSLCFSVGSAYYNFKPTADTEYLFTNLDIPENPVFEIPPRQLNNNNFFDFFIYLECLYNPSITETKHLNTIYHHKSPSDFVYGYEKFNEYVTLGADYILEAIHYSEGEGIEFITEMAQKYIDIDDINIELEDLEINA